MGVILIGLHIDFFELPVEALHESIVKHLICQDLVLYLKVDYRSDVSQYFLKLLIAATLNHSLQFLHSAVFVRLFDIDGVGGAVIVFLFRVGWVRLTADHIL